MYAYRCICINIYNTICVCVYIYIFFLTDITQKPILSWLQELLDPGSQKWHQAIPVGKL